MELKKKDIEILELYGRVVCLQRLLIHSWQLLGLLNNLAGKEFFFIDLNFDNFLCKKFNIDINYIKTTKENMNFAQINKFYLIIMNFKVISFLTYHDFCYYTKKIHFFLLFNTNEF